MKQLKLQFSIRITEGTNVLTDDDRNLNIIDFPVNEFTIDPDVTDIDSLYDEFIEEYYPDCNIFEPTFHIYPIINDEVLDIELSEEIDPDGVFLEDIENWLKENRHIQWLRVYQLENNLGII
jgi:hypothetical protein